MRQTEGRRENMELTLWLNGTKITDTVAADTVLLDFLRRHGCASVKRG